ncbi:MAG: S8 family serine peptidase [Solirubrobacteraceae bacterium]|jgi:serine protease
MLVTADTARLHRSRRLRRLALAAVVGLLAIAPAAARAAAAPYVPGVVVVGFANGTPAAARGALLVRAGMARVSAPQSDVREVHLRRGVGVADAIARLRANRSVLWAVPDYIAHEAGTAESLDPYEAVDPVDLLEPFSLGSPFQLAAPFIPNDPGSAGTPGGWQQLQWNFVGQYGVGAPQAWANLIADGHPGGSGVTVAVLDTGVAYANHGRYVRSPDFSPYEFVHGWDFVANSPYPEDRNGHGTQVAGTIAEETNNGVGVTGLAYGVRLMPIRVLNGQGNGDATRIAEGVDFAVNHHAQIINMSLEFTAGTITANDIPQLIAAIDYAHSKNVLVVAAAGNESMAQLSYPAKARYVLAVGASTDDGCLAYYSNYGAALDLVAPGGGGDAAVPGDANCVPDSATAGPDIIQETFLGLNYPDPRVFGLPDGYYGTSMAAPHVSATAALVIASGVLGPHPTVAEIVARLEATATPLGPNGVDDPTHYGYGLVNAAAATAPTGSTGPTGTSGPTGAT